MKHNPKIVLAFFRQEGLPEPALEWCFHPERKWRFDFAWPDNTGPMSRGYCGQKVALEVEGGIWTRGAHGRGSGISRDMEKYNEAAALGWRVLRVTPKDLCLVSTAELIRRTLNA